MNFDEKNQKTFFRKKTSFFAKKTFFWFFSSKFISFYFLEFLSDFDAWPLKISGICSTFRKKSKKKYSLSASHTKSQISVLVYFVFFLRKYSWILHSKPKIFENFEIFWKFKKKSTKWWAKHLNPIKTRWAAYVQRFSRNCQWSGKIGGKKGGAPLMHSKIKK